MSSADEEKDGGALDDISSADALKLVQSMTNVVDDTLNSKYAKKYNKRLSMYKSRLGVSKKSNRSTGRSFSKSFRATKGSRSIDKSKQNVRKLRVKNKLVAYFASDFSIILIFPYFYLCATQKRILYLSFWIIGLIRRRRSF